MEEEKTHLHYIGINMAMQKLENKFVRDWYNFNEYRLSPIKIIKIGFFNLFKTYHQISKISGIELNTTKTELAERSRASIL